MPNRQHHWIARIYLWLTERLYNELAWVYDLVSWLVSLGNWDTVRKWALEYTIGSRMLEIGFGTGELLIALARQQIQVVGLDRSPAMQRVARRKLRRRGVSIPLVEGLTQAAPFASQSFDTILATYPAGYLLESETWQELARLLRPPAGRLVVVGMWYAFTLRRSQTHAPLEGTVWAKLQAQCQELAQSAGLELQVVMRRHGKMTFPILLAERRS